MVKSRLREQHLLGWGLFVVAVLFMYGSWNFFMNKDQFAKISATVLYTGVAVLPALGWLLYRRIQLSAIDAASLAVQEAMLKMQDEAIERAKEQLDFLTFHDELTGLFNRSYFEAECRRKDRPEWFPLTVVVGDLNGLKLVNDAFGHQVGDEFLRKAASILRNCLRQGDLCARWGGDEFVLLLPKTDGETANEVCNRIRQVCQAYSKDEPVELSIALGMATKTGPQPGMDAVIQEAEDNMCRRKILESKSTRNSILASLERSLAEKSHETEEHAARLKELSLKVGRLVGLSEAKLDELSLLASLHDIGKIATPETILMKPGELTPQEWDLMKKHAEIGYRIAQTSPVLAPIAEAILSHHEWWDGGGYPQGLQGTEIPLIARIVSVVDAIDAMTNDRPYRKAMSMQAALDELVRCSGTQFDPAIVQVIMGIFGPEQAAST